MSDQIEGNIAPLRERLDAMHQQREAALGQCRRIIQMCSRTIRMVHRREFAEAAAMLRETEAKLREAQETLAPHPALYYTGYLQDAEKEFVEAACVLRTAQREPLPSADALGVGTTSYLNGLGEAASELRRYVLDEMREGNMAESKRLLETMEGIYDSLITLDYPDSLTGGLRRTCDALRAVVERTRSDLAITSTQRALIQELRRVHPTG